MIKFSTVNPGSITNEAKVKIHIESPTETIDEMAINVFGGIIEQYDKDSPVVVVVPFGLGEMTPGMMFSHISSLISCVVTIFKERCSDIPEEIIWTMAQKAIEEGLECKGYLPRKKKGSKFFQ